MTLVLCHGVFDLLHLGHIQHFKQAAEMGDSLMVSVTADEFVNKGMGRPHFTAEQRAEALRALKIVDSVVINRSCNAVNMINTYKPQIYCKGIDYAGEPTVGLQEEIAAVKAIGGEVRFTSTGKLSSSRLINVEKFGDETVQYLDKVKKAGGRDKILQAFDLADEKAILFVGERINDVYRYVRGLGRASKELMLATVVTGEEVFDGGVWAASKQGEWKTTRICTPHHSMTKTRYVDGDFYRKILDVYSTTSIELTPAERHTYRDWLKEECSSADVVIVFDFGHGLFGRVERHAMEQHPWVAVNAQTNAGNYGFNPVTKYNRPKYVCIDEPEVRLAMQDQFSPLHGLIQELQVRQRCYKYLITRGRGGSVWQRSGVYGEAPALAHGGVDTMGAGDAVMAVTAPLVAVGLDMELAAFVGNIVGAIKIGTVGHRTHVKRNEIIQTVEALLA